MGGGEQTPKTGKGGDGSDLFTTSKSGIVTIAGQNYTNGTNGSHFTNYTETHALFTPPMGGGEQNPETGTEGDDSGSEGVSVDSNSITAKNSSDSSASNESTNVGNLIGAIVGPIALGILVTVGIKRLIIPGNFPITRLQSVVRGRQARKREAAVKTIQAAFRERQQAQKQSAAAKENKLATTKQSVVRFKRLSQAFEVLKQNKKQKDEAAELVTGSLVATQHRLDWDETIHGGSNSHVAAGSSLTPENRHRAKRLPDFTVHGTPQNNLNPTGHGLWKSDDSRQNP